tara:strand:+ start:82 stop:486 length:405 start_codon:yes stop_codon:yes gene_type:complete
MKKVLFLIPIALLVACNTANNFQPIKSSLALQEELAIGDSSDNSFPVEGTQFVSLHADRELRLNKSCSQVLKLQLVQSRDYRETLVELKNRAILMGGNSVSLVNWREYGNRTGLIGNIYICRAKTYHIHPHPGT